VNVPVILAHAAGGGVVVAATQELRRSWLAQAIHVVAGWSLAGT